jgi:hypothetical protein
MAPFGFGQTAISVDLTQLEEVEKVQTAAALRAVAAVSLLQSRSARTSAFGLTDLCQDPELDLHRTEGTQRRTDARVDGSRTGIRAL